MKVFGCTWGALREYLLADKQVPVKKNLPRARKLKKHSLLA
jgi:hypothetical protein